MKTHTQHHKALTCVKDVATKDDGPQGKRAWNGPLPCPWPPPAAGKEAASPVQAGKEAIVVLLQLLQLKQLMLPRVEQHWEEEGPCGCGCPHTAHLQDVWAGRQAGRQT